MRRWGREAGGRMDAFYTRSILASRPTVHISWRLLYRAGGLLELSGRSTAGAGMWHWVLPLFVVSDLVQWLILRRSDKLGLGWRLVADGLDIAFWSLSPLPPNGTYDAPVLVGVPLAAEAGVQLGVRALVVPLSALTIVGTIRTLAGRPVLPFTFLWLVLAVGVGWALNAYCRRLYQEAERERARRRDADHRRAFIVGQNAVAMGASSVVDAIEGLVPVLGRPSERSALWHLAAGWKTELGRTTRAEVVYLRDALGEWERRHNQHPDLSSRVELRLAEGHGTVMLSAAQARWFVRWLASQQLRGRTPVTVVDDATQRPPGVAVRVQVGVHVASVPPDKDAILRPVDPGPVTFLFAGGQCLTVLSLSGPAVPLGFVLVMMAMCLATGRWAHGRLLAKGRAARPAILRASVALAVALTVLGSATARNGVTDSGERVYVGVGLILLGYLGGIYWYGLSRSQVLLVFGGVVACSATTLLLIDGPHHVRSFLAMFLGNIATFPTCRRISVLLTRASEEYAVQAQEEDRASVEEAFQRGRDTVIDLVRQARDDACRQLRTVETALEPRLATLVSERLKEVDRRLERMDTDPAWSLSTTTS
ncbi:MAG: hypothetical protein ACRD2W_06840 [Acidimicrobiales bacterium]